MKRSVRVMYDKGKVIIGSAILVAFFTSPIWYNKAVGREVPELEMPVSGE